MKLYHRIIAYGLMVAGSIGCLGCDPPTTAQKAPEPVYLTGRVKNENFQNNFIDSDIYTFSLNTEHGLKLFKCIGDDSAASLDALVDPGDEVKIKLDLHEKIEDSDFYVSKKDVVEINGQKRPQ